MDQIKRLNESTSGPKAPAPIIDRNRLATLLNIDYDGETLRGTTDSVIVPENSVPDVDPKILSAINKDYSELMKAMNMRK